MGIIIEKFDEIALKCAKEKIKENPKYLEECMIHVDDAGLYAMLLTSGGSYDIDGGLPELKRFLVENGENEEKETRNKKEKEIKHDTLNLTKVEAVKILAELAFSYSLHLQDKTEAKVWFVLADKLKFDSIHGIAEDTLDEKENRLLIVNLKNIGRAAADEFVDDMEFVDILMALNHQYRHMDGRLNQYDNMRDNDKEAAALAISYLARVSDIYFDANYYQMISELDAEQFAVNKTAEALSQYIDAETAEKLVIDYVNERAILGENKIDYKNFFEKETRKRENEEKYRDIRNDVDAEIVKNRKKINENK